MQSLILLFWDVKIKMKSEMNELETSQFNTYFVW